MTDTASPQMIAAAALDVVEAEAARRRLQADILSEIERGDRPDDERESSSTRRRRATTRHTQARQHLRSLDADAARQLEDIYASHSDRAAAEAQRIEQAAAAAAEADARAFIAALDAGRLELVQPSIARAGSAAFSPIAPPAQPISPAMFYALHRAILAAQAAREQRTDRNDWPILAEAERSDAEGVLLRYDAAPFDCAAAAVYAVAIDAIGPAPRISWSGEMDSFRIEWGEAEAAAPQQNESE